MKEYAVDRSISLRLLEDLAEYSENRPFPLDEVHWSSSFCGGVDFMAKDKVAVIGSNSFSGSDFIDLLLEEKRFSVIGISRSEEKSSLFLSYKRHISPDFEFFCLDLNKDLDRILKLLDSFQPDYIVNFAAQGEVATSWKFPAQWFQTNVIALTELALALKERSYFKRYLHISSPEIYGACEGRITESAPFNPSTPYAVSKAAGDLSIFTFVKHFSFPAVTIRATNVYGAHQQLFRIIPRSIIRIKKGETIELHGGGKVVKSYIHIRDVSHGELKAMENGKPGFIYHLSPDQGISVRHLVERICKKMGVSFEASTRNVAERLGQDKAYVIDSTRARTEFNWEPKIPMDKGLTEVISWVNEHWEEIQGEPMDYLHKP